MQENMKCVCVYEYEVQQIVLLFVAVVRPHIHVDLLD